jgi:hypothetical protein
LMVVQHGTGRNISIALVIPSLFILTSG